MEQKFFICEHCGNIIAMVNDTGVPVMCCGQKMTQLVPNTVDAAFEKHVPVYTVEGDLVHVTVGSVEHPMLPEHYIQWISLHTKQGNKVLFLDELLEFLEGKEGLYVEFEMKTKPEALYPEERLHAYCDKLYDAVMAVKPADATFVFTSGDYRGLRYLQAKHPGVDLLLITSKPCNDETIDLCKAMGIKRMGATMDGTSRKAVKKAHKEGLTVILWPGQSVEDFMLGAYLGCDLMCTDVPIRVKNWLAENAPYIKVKY